MRSLTYAFATKQLRDAVKLSDVPTHVHAQELGVSGSTLRCWVIGSSRGPVEKLAALGKRVGIARKDCWASTPWWAKEA